MCGIFGFNFENKKLIKLMIKSLKHRGPNHSSSYNDKNISIGYTRLSIIDLEGGNQPMYNENGSLVLFFNGEIYNFEELRVELEKKGHNFLTRTDTEVIVHAYEEYGHDCLKHFNGMFSFIIYDSKNKEIFIARDRLGIKPLYYYFEDKTFVFASEIKALYNYDKIKKEIKTDVINRYFTHRYCPGESTIFKGIKKLLPGHYLVYKKEKIKIKKYWDLSFNIKKSPINKISREFRDIFEQSVKYRMISDVSIGALLSGGIDSSSIVAMMRKNTDDKIRTYTLGFENGIKNEFGPAKLISEKFNTDHKEFTIDSSYIKYLPEIVKQLDEPLADPTVLPNYVLAKKTSGEIKVLLNGDGADEILGGYEQYRYMKYLKYYSYAPKILRKTFIESMKILPKEPFFLKLNEFLKNADNIDESYKSLISVFGEEEKKYVYSKTFKNELNNNNSFDEKYLKIKADSLNKMLFHDIKTYLSDNMLMKFDRLTMAKSIEGRVPFCDHKLVEFSTRIPIEYKLKGFNEKFILRHSMKNILPKKIIKKKKQRFMVPTDTWYTKEFGEFSKNLIDENEQLIEKYLDPTYINKIQNSDKFLSTKLMNFNRHFGLYYSRQLWSVTNFLLWHNEFIDRNH
ncbi:asparagine synthase (glutamine-hydrolyzing) [archaeon]|nr:asparagine synthase (glutamine-hydrolyzing) [archaeon]